MEKMNIYQKLAAARVEFLQTPTKKSGYNKFSNFPYFELSDILPVATPIFTRLGLVTQMCVTEEGAVMSVINTENPDEQMTFTSPVRFPELKGQNAIQVLGSCHTYLRRYLWMLVLDLVECDGIDAMAGAPEAKKPSPAQPQLSPEVAQSLEQLRALAKKYGKKADLEAYLEKHGGTLPAEQIKSLAERLTQNNN